MKRRNASPIVLLWQYLHVQLYRLSGGRLGARLLKMPILLLTTIGRRTGKSCIKALTYVFNDGDYILAASNGGSDFHPHWWINLKSKPSAEIMLGANTLKVYASELEGKKREELWEQFIAMENRYAIYKKRTQRRIPLIRLAPEMVEN